MKDEWDSASEKTMYMTVPNEEQHIWQYGCQVQEGRTRPKTGVAKARPVFNTVLEHSPVLGFRYLC